MTDKLKRYKFYYSFLFFVIFIGFLVRAWNINKNPAGFFCDEASFEYNAYSILTTGKDEHSVTYPVYFKAFGEYKNPIYIYSAVPIVAIFGLTEFSIRFTSVIYGTLTILILFFLVKDMFNIEIALLSSLFLSISPWHIHFSRFGFEVISTPFWVCLSILLLFKSLRNFRFYPITIISFIISFLTYNPPKIYLFPLYLVFFVVFFYRTKFWLKSKLFWFYNIAGIILLMFFIMPYLLNGVFFTRWNQVKMESMTVSNILTAYLNHFSPVFLFQSGEIDFPGSFISRTSIRGIGELFLFQLPLLTLFIFFFIKEKKFQRESFFILLFLLIYPLSSIFTNIIPSATRSIIGVVPFQILSAIGLYNIYTFVKNKRINIINNIFISLLSIIIILSFTIFISKLKTYPNYSSDFWGWQYGPREIISYFIEQRKKYDELFMEGSFNAPEIFLKFYDPKNECKNCQIGGIDRYDIKKKQLFAIKSEELEKINWRYVIKKKINYPNGDIAFFLITHEIF